MAAAAMPNTAHVKRLSINTAYVPSGSLDYWWLLAPRSAQTPTIVRCDRLPGKPGQAAALLVVGVLAGIFSLVGGAALLFGIEDVLPSLEHVFG